jgi:hypothetical protein
MSTGLRVIKPWGDRSRYDFVVETGGRFLRVQVKSTSSQRSKHYVCAIDARGKKPHGRRHRFFRDLCDSSR